MKKRFGLILLFFILNGTVFVFAANSSAVIKDILGTVEIKTSGSSDWVLAKEGTVIEKNTIISTGFRSSANLLIGSSILTVRPVTRLSLEELITLNETETISVRLNTGRIRVEVTPPAGSKSNLSVQTPATTASVRGTAFEMDTVSIHVLSGAVNFTSADYPASVTVRANQESQIDADTGKIITPMTAMEMSGALPVMFGESTASASGGGSIQFEIAGTNIGITIIPKEPPAGR